MDIVDKVLLAQQNDEYCEQFIKENTAFICKCAGQAARKALTQSDDEFSEALIAFHQAVLQYAQEKGAFYAFAATCIQNRIRDYYRRENRHGNVIPFGALSSENKDGKQTPFEAEAKDAGISETALEIYSVKEELKAFGICFDELPKASPKSKKTRRGCLEVVRHIVRKKELLDYVYTKKALPAKQLLAELKISEKLLERHRKYLLFGVIIINGNYEILLGYFDPEYRR